MVKILFVCKYNRFRSKVAEIYLKKVNKTKGVLVRSRGIIEVNKPLDSAERKRNKYLKKQFGFVLYGKSLSVDVKSLLWADRIIIVADDIPAVLFNSTKWRDKIEVWKVPDEKADNIRNINKSVGIIIKKVDALVKKLSDANRRTPNCKIREQK
jgi:protein-tyrosine-phosphatase